MKRTHLVLSTLLIITAIITAIVTLSATLFAADEPEKASVASLVKGNTAFALKMHQELIAKEGNLLFSPYSISSALGMIYAGARGNTGKEMKAALNFTMEQHQLPSAFKRLNQELLTNAQKAGQKLQIANGLCLTGGDVDNEFKALLKENFAAEVFGGDLNLINDWVKEKTEGKIEKILEKLNPNSVCVLLNAIYFKGTWANKFKIRSTEVQPFKMSATEYFLMSLMHQKGRFKYLELKNFQAVTLPYQGGTLSMIILLPYTIDGLPDLEKQLTPESLAHSLAMLDAENTQKIELYLPRFKLDFDYDMVPPCNNLSIKDAFDMQKADFQGMGLPKGSFCISQIKHKAFIEVDEEGSRAAAATAVSGMTIGLRMDLPNPTFRADHPFLFLIKDNETGTILFMGRVVNPNNEKLQTLPDGIFFQSNITATGRPYFDFDVLGCFHGNEIFQAPFARGSSV